MPTYRYKCDYCGHEQEEWLWYPRPTPTVLCSICKHEAKRRWDGVRINYIMNNAYVPGVNAEHDMEVATDYYEHRLYSDDQQIQSNPNMQINKAEI